MKGILVKGIFIFLTIKIMPLLIGSSALKAMEAGDTINPIYINENGELFVKTGVPFYLFVSASQSEDGYLTHKEESPLVINEHGTHYLTLITEPNKKEKEVKIFADGKAPVSKIEIISGLVFHFGDRYYVNTPSEICIRSRDEESGLGNTFYSIGDSAFKAISGCIKVEGLPEAVVQFYSEDEVGNREATKQVRLIFNPQAIIPLENIYFAHNSAAILSESKKELDKLAGLLKEYPEIRIELMAHTDSRGSSSYNMSLSERRAQNTRDYLIGKGIAASRLVATGYGDTQPVNKCVKGETCSEAEHAQNRRTEFRILPF